MNIPSLATYKKARKAYGSVGSMYWLFSETGIHEDDADHAIDGLTTDIGCRCIEKTKSKNLYDFCEGVILYHLEHNTKYVQQQSTTS
jgi:hypothetical protein